MTVRTILAIAAFTAVALPATAQDERVFTPGELVQPGGGETWKIVQCRPEKVSRDTECEAVLWKNGGAASTAQWMFARQIAAGEQRVKDAARLAAMTETPPADPAPTPPAQPAAAPKAPADPEDAPLPPPSLAGAAQ